MKRIVWSKKKGIVLAGLIGALFSLLLPLIPVFNCMDKARTPQYYFGNIIELFTHLPEKGNPAVMWALLGASWALLISCFVFLVRSLRASPLDGDIEDKNFVFGYFFFVLSNVLAALLFFGIESFVGMALYLALTFAGIIAIIYHYRVLSSI